MIDESQAVAAAEWLLEHAEEIGEARANMEQLDAHKKIVRASLMRQAPSDCRSASDREAWAYSHPSYLIAADGYASACGNFERLRQMVSAKSAYIDLFRTFESSRRRV